MNEPVWEAAVRPELQPLAVAQPQNVACVVSDAASKSPL